MIRGDIFCLSETKTQVEENLNSDRFYKGGVIVKIRIMAFVSIFVMVVLAGCIKIYTSPPDSEATDAPEQAQNSQDSQAGEPDQPKPATSGNLVEPDLKTRVPLPDLMPTEIVYDSASVSIGKNIYFDSGIRNDGAVDSEGFNIKWFVNGEQLGHGGHPGIPANGVDMTSNSQFSWAPPAAGDYVIEFFVDSENTLKETDESNNTVTITVSIPQNSNAISSDGWPIIEGLSLDNGIYYYTAGNPYGKNAGDVAGNIRPNVYVKDIQTGGICLKPIVCRTLLLNKLAEIPSGQLKLKVIVPLDIFNYDGDVKIDELALVAKNGKSYNVIEVVCESTVSIMNFTDAPHLAAWYFELESGDKMDAIANRIAYDNFDLARAYNNVVILSSGSELKHQDESIGDEYLDTYYGSVTAVKLKYSTIYLDFVNDDYDPDSLIDFLYFVDGKVLFMCE